jgi:hypothetical protein
MKKSILILFALLLCLNVYSQSMGNRNNNRNSSRIPQSNAEPTEQQIAKQKREMEERKAEYIANFLTTLEADDFQKEITKQTISSYFDAKVALFQVRYERSIDRQDAMKNLEKSHFKDLKTLISEDDMTKVNEMISGDFDEKEVVKEKKKKKKKKKKKNKKDEDEEDEDEDNR